MEISKQAGLRQMWLLSTSILHVYYKMHLSIPCGVPFLVNPDLLERFCRDAPLNAADESIFYGDDECGYTDYSFLNNSPARMVSCAWHTGIAREVPIKP